jgi:predicted Zn-dependent protease
MLLDEKYAALLAGAGFLALGRGRTDKAGAIFDAMSAEWPHRFAPLLGKSLVLILAGEPEKGAQLLEKEAASQQADPLWGAFHALALAEAGKTGDAREELSALLSSDPEHPDKAMARALFSQIG